MNDELPWMLMGISLFAGADANPRNVSFCVEMIGYLIRSRYSFFIMTSCMVETMMFGISDFYLLEHCLFLSISIQNTCMFIWNNNLNALNHTLHSLNISMILKIVLLAIVYKRNRFICLQR